MADEQMLFPYRNTTRQFKEMEMQGIPVNMANLAIHRQREEEMNQERMRSERILQEAAEQQQETKDYRLNTHSKELPCNRAFKVKKNPKKKQEELIGEDISEMKKRLHNDP
ncbi:hypothetical protein PIB30_097499 [Stylosanthes scabra]|uniref:Uncharacterized protein n=1 Tax=Stylosanthes scabra TaxID=79078 RepID=A0ABU6XYT7_9FABA|nr:hypothetical protein [Stylosanthes scabra]